MEEKVHRRQKSLTPSLLDKHFAVALGDKDEAVKKDENRAVESKMLYPQPIPTRLDVSPNPPQNIQIASSISVKMESPQLPPHDVPEIVHSNKEQVSSRISNSISLVEVNVVRELPPQSTVANISTAHTIPHGSIGISSSQVSQVPPIPQQFSTYVPSQTVHNLPPSMPSVSINPSIPQTLQAPPRATNPQPSALTNISNQTVQMLPSSMPNTSTNPSVSQPFLSAPNKMPQINYEGSSDKIRKKSLEKRKLRAYSTNLAMQGFWKRMLQEMHNIDEETIDFNDQSIPLQRCKEIFDAEKKHLNLSNIHCDSSAVVTMSKVCEMLVLELVKRSLLSRENPEDRSSIKVDDVLNAIRDNELYDLFSEHL